LDGISDQSAGQKRQRIVVPLIDAHFRRRMGVDLLCRFRDGRMVLKDRGKGNTF
jgi:hypothetical protein